MRVLSWFFDRDGFNWPRILLVALTGTLLVAVGVVGATSTADFGPYNPAWDGTSEFRSDLEQQSGIEREFVSDTARYSEVDPNETVAFVVAPDRTYDEAALDRIRAFLEDGGTLVVMEDYGESGATLLDDLGTEARLDGDILRDDRNYQEGRTMPVATGVGNHTLTTDVEQLTLNYGTAIEPGNATVLVRTSEFAYLVENESEELDEDDELGAYPVATLEELGDGTVIVISDPSIAINAMYDEPDNAVFLTGVSTQGERVLFDVSHDERLPPLTAALLRVRDSPGLQVVLGLGGILACGILSRRRVGPVARRLLTRLPGTFWSAPPQDSQQMSDEERARYLRQRHPDWDEQRIEAVIKALNRHPSEQEKRDR